MPAPEPRPPDPPELPGTNLFAEEVMQALTDQERKFALYTGARCPPDKREKIIELMGEGQPIDRIRRLVNVHRQTVLNVANQFAAEIADYERRMTAKLRRCKWGLADRIEREVDAIPRQALGLTLKIVSDIEAMDSGRAIARVDHVHRIDLFSDFPTFVQELEARPVIDEKNGAPAGRIHLSGGNNLLMNGAPADPAADQDRAPTTGDPGPASDWKSEVSTLPTQESQPTPPTFTPDKSPKSTAIDAADAHARAAADADRRGGDAAPRQPPDPKNDNGSLKFSANGL
jgi:hypothetical protein